MAASRPRTRRVSVEEQCRASARRSLRGVAAHSASLLQAELRTKKLEIERDRLGAFVERDDGVALDVQHAAHCRDDRGHAEFRDVQSLRDRAGDGRSLPLIEESQQWAKLVVRGSHAAGELLLRSEDFGGKKQFHPRGHRGRRQNNSGGFGVGRGDRDRLWSKDNSRRARLPPGRQLRRDFAPGAECLAAENGQRYYALLRRRPAVVPKALRAAVASFFGRRRNDRVPTKDHARTRQPNLDRKSTRL